MYQAAWRAKHDLDNTKQETALQWQQQYGQYGQEASRYAIRSWLSLVPLAVEDLSRIVPALIACRSALDLDTAYLQGLFLCVNVTSQEDVAKLVQAAQLVLSSQDSAGKLGMLHRSLVHL